VKGALQCPYQAPTESLAVTVAYGDFETFSACNLRKCGAHRYSQDPSTGIFCFNWALDDDPISEWYPGDPDPHRLLEHIESGGRLSGWNSGGFEVYIWNNVLRKRYCPHWPELKIEQIDDTMARAYARAFPGKLEECAVAVGVKQKKDMEGHRLMMQMCVPTKEWSNAVKKGLDAGPPVFITDPVKIKRLGAYCSQDVRTERELSKYIAPLSERERQAWLLDWYINNRGVRVDECKVQAALDIAESEKKRLTKELHQVTKCSGYVVVTPEKTTKAGKFIPEKRTTKTRVETANSNPQMLSWFEHHGLKIPNLKKKKLDRLRREEKARRDRGEPTMSDAVFRTLEIRLETAKASNAKLSAMLAGRSFDGRCRQLFSYHVATTGRWAGRRVQLQNMPRPEFPGLHEDYYDKHIEECISLLDEPRGIDIISMCFGDPLPVISSCLRGLLIPAEGKRYVGADFSGIEGRVDAWLAGEAWKLHAYRELDAGRGNDMYKLAYSQSFGVPVSEVTKPQRQVGKVEELALGFGGGVGALVGMADNLGVILSDIAKTARDATAEDIWRETAEWCPHVADKRFNLDVDTWTGLKVIVNAWRNAHPETKDFWYDLENCAIDAIWRKKEIQITKTGLVKFVSDGTFLFCQLPSKRVLCYAKPSVIEVPWVTRKGKKKKKYQVQYYGQGKKSKKWEARRTYGGHLCENSVQATARDILLDAMFRIEAAGYPIVIHVHDEPVAEVPLGFGSPEEFKQLMCDSEPWLAGCPIDANAWAGHRFGK
jgi:DNA polymerase